MRLKRSILILVLFANAAAAQVMPKNLLRDGFVLAGVDGKLAAEGEKWFFKADSDVNDSGAIVKAGTGLELLPSATLEKMTADVNDRSDTSYRIWARVTRCGDRNFVFAVYFLPMSKIKSILQAQPQQQQQPQKEQQPSEQQQGKAVINEPNDALKVPDEVIALLKTKEIPREAVSRFVSEQPEKRIEFKQDTMLVDRIGFIRPVGLSGKMGAKSGTGTKKESTQYEFIFDAFGWNASSAAERLHLLPCEALELTQQRQAIEAEQIRFKIAGILTKYKGDYYLLLQRAAQVYSYGNFSR